MGSASALDLHCRRLARQPRPKGCKRRKSACVLIACRLIFGETAIVSRTRSAAKLTIGARDSSASCPTRDDVIQAHRNARVRADVPRA